MPLRRTIDSFSSPLIPWSSDTNTILITGVSSGFGLETARLFLERGWRVIAAMWSPSDDLLPPSDRLRTLPLDVNDANSIAAAVEQAGPIDALVNNAGAGMRGALEGISIHAIRDLFELDLFGPMALTTAVLPGLRAQGSGVIVNVSSATTMTPLPLLSAYTASKAALEAFSNVLALEVAPFGIRVRLVIPGRAPGTPFGAAARSRSEGGVPDAYADWAKHIVSAAQPDPGLLTTPGDVADAIWRAVTDPSTFARLPAGADAIALARSG